MIVQATLDEDDAKLVYNSDFLAELTSKLYELDNKWADASARIIETLLDDIADHFESNVELNEDTKATLAVAKLLEERANDRA